MSLAEPAVTWIRVEKPSFDLAGILVSSLSIAGICVAVAVALGCAYGAAIVWRRRRRPRSWADGGLHLRDAERP